MGFNKKTFLLLLLIFVGLGLFAQENELPNKDSGLKELRNKLQTRDDIIEIQWRNIVTTIRNEQIPSEEKIEMVAKFVNDFPNDNKYLEEAKPILVELIEEGPNSIDLVKRKSYRTKTELFALNFAGGNFGFGGGFTFVTLRWNHVFLEVFRIQVTGAKYFQSSRKGISANGKIMVGTPFFLDKTNKHEIRISSGFSGGFTAKYPKTVDEGFNFYDESYINLPVDVSYVFHKDKNFAFQVGVAVDIPLWSLYDFFLIMNGFIGFRV